MFASKKKAYESSQLMKSYVIQFWLNNNLFLGETTVDKGLQSLALHYLVR